MGGAATGLLSGGAAVNLEAVRGRGCCSQWVGGAAAVCIGGRGCHGPAEERGQYRPAEGGAAWCSPVVGGRGCFFPQSLQHLKQGVKSKEGCNFS